MVEPIRYGEGGQPMVNQPREIKVEPVEKTATVKKERNNLFKKSMEMMGFDEEIEECK